MKKHFLFNYEWAEVLSEYSAEVRLEVYDAIIRYAQSGTLSELKPQAKMAFSFIKKEIDYNNDQYTNTVNARKEAGSKGGKAKQNKQMVAKQANATFAKQNKQTQANDSIDDNENVNDNENEYDFRRHDAHMRERLKNLVFFGRPIQLDQLCKRWETTSEELNDICNQVLDEWESKGEIHLNENDARRHLHDHVRKKYSILKTKQNETNRPSRQDRLSERRGTEPGSNGQEVYTDTL